MGLEGLCLRQSFALGGNVDGHFDKDTLVLVIVHGIWVRNWESVFIFFSLD